ncbi:MAG: PAS domain-containing protein [Kiloniellaceae bacterium]
MLQMIAQREQGQTIGPVVADGLEFLSPILTEALAYWQGIKGDARFPKRHDLEPEQIVKLWPHLLMVDVVDGGSDYYVRLFGQNLVDTYGEQTGRRLSEATVPDLVRHRSRRLFDFCRDQVVPTYAYWPESASERRPFIDVEARCLPLSGDGTTLDRMMSLNVNSRRGRSL